MLTPYDRILKTPFGWIAVRLQDDSVQELALLPAKPPVDESDDPLAERIMRQLQRYLDTGMWPQNLPLNPRGTVFQHRVWSALLEIPVGQTKTYGELARKLGTSPRAIGGACRANPIPLLIPCHRIVAAGSDGGFAGHGSGYWMDIKRWLLQLEAAA